MRRAERSHVQEALVQGLFGFLGQLIAGAVLLLAGYRLALRQIASQHWFNKKVEVYAEIVHDLTVHERWAKERERALTGDLTFNAVAMVRLDSLKAAADRRLAERREDTFFLPAQVVEELNAFDEAINAVWRSDPSSTGWASSYASFASVAVQEVKEAAERELGISTNLRSHHPSQLRQLTAKFQRFADSARRADSLAGMP
jgi:hypothetical protein